MPIDAHRAQNQFLATVATVLQRGTVNDPATLETVAKEAAAEIAKQSPGTDVVDLMQSLPKEWREQPGSSSTRSLASAFLQVAGPVLGVELGTVQPLATRGLASARDNDVKIAVNRAQLAAQASAPALDAPLHLGTADAGDVMAALTAALADKLLLQRIGGEKYKHAARADLARELAGILGDARGEPPGPAVYAGGVEVAGPSVSAAYAARPHGAFFSLAAPVSAGTLAKALVELHLVRSSIDEEAARSAVLGARAQLVSGHVPTSDAFPFHLVVQPDGRAALGLALDLAALREYQRTDLDDAALTKSVGALLRARMDEVAALGDQGIPPGLALDASLQDSPTLIAARSARRAGGP